jgi:putative exporter of polyketide antibiotics
MPDTWPPPSSVSEVQGSEAHAKVPQTHERAFAFLTLMTSAGTLVCCVLPAVMVFLGLGSTLVGLLTAVPQLIWLSENKLLVFGVGAVFLALGGFAQWQARNAPCPLDPALAKACMTTRRRSLYIYLFALSLYLTGFGFAFVLPRLLAGPP